MPSNGSDQRMAAPQGFLPPSSVSPVKAACEPDKGAPRSCGMTFPRRSCPASRAAASRRAADAFFVHYAGAGPAVLLLHGFPETSLMWRVIAPLLAADFAVVAADLPGYGGSDGRREERRSFGPVEAPDGGNAGGSQWPRSDMTASPSSDMTGGGASLTGWRSAILASSPVSRLGHRSDPRGLEPGGCAARPLVLALLAAGPAAPLPERLILGAPEAVIDLALGEWGTPREAYTEEVRRLTSRLCAIPPASHAICEEYRAAATCDREHDAADVEAARRIVCPTLVLWSASGALGSWYADSGGRSAFGGAGRRRGRRSRAGRSFFPEEHPNDTASVFAVSCSAASGPSHSEPKSYQRRTED